MKMEMANGKWQMIFSASTPALPIALHGFLLILTPAPESVLARLAIHKQGARFSRDYFG